MSRRRGSATALNASEVVAARAMRSSIHSDMGICQALSAKHQKSAVQVDLLACGWNPTRRKLQAQSAGKKRSLAFVLHPWIASGLIRLGVWFWAPSLI